MLSLGRGGGQVVMVLSDDPSSNHAEVDIFS